MVLLGGRGRGAKAEFGGESGQENIGKRAKTRSRGREIEEDVTDAALFRILVLQHWEGACARFYSKEICLQKMETRRKKLDMSGKMKCSRYRSKFKPVNNIFTMFKLFRQTFSANPNSHF